MYQKIWTSLTLLVFIFLALVVLWAMTEYYADLPQRVSQLEIITTNMLTTLKVQPTTRTVSLSPDDLIDQFTTTRTFFQVIQDGDIKVMFLG
jgi:Tfp pilus assembly protein PilV